MSVSGCETIAVNSGIKLEIRKQNASAPREWQMKGWKKERQRRKELLRRKRFTKQFNKDLEEWARNLLHFQVQTINRLKNEPELDK